MGLFRANDETNDVNEHNMVKDPSWREADQLAIYKHDRGELGSTEKQLPNYDVTIELFDMCR